MFLIEKMERLPCSSTEAGIIRYLLKERYLIADKSMLQLAQETFSSKSALVRLAQKLDFSGWTAFREAFLAELAYMDQQKTAIDANLPFKAGDDIYTITHQLTILKKETIEETQALLNIKTLKASIDCLEAAETIHVLAVSNNLLNAQEFQLQMSRIQKDVRLHSLQGEAIFGAYLAKANSCAIVISYSGETSFLLDCMHFLRQHRVPIIFLTSIGENSSTQLATHTLRMATKERLYSKIGTFSTDTAITYLLDCLYAGVFASNYTSNLALRQGSSEIVEFERTSSSAILQEKQGKHTKPGETKHP